MFGELNDRQKSRFFNSLLAVFILLAVFLAILSLNALKASSFIGRGSAAADVISVSGKGEVLAVPDTGEFSFSVVETGKTVGDAQNTASKKINAIIDALKALGIDKNDIKTSGYNAYPKYEYSQASICANGFCPPSKQVLTGYEVNQTIDVKVRKTADAGTVLTKVGDLGATNISGLNFVIDDMDKVNAEAQAKAIADAKNKADILAKSLGVHVKRVVNFYESGQTPIYYGMAAEGKAMDLAAPTAVPQIPTGENKIVSNVTITYEIE
jgi:uncharacterized protein YggE